MSLEINGKAENRGRPRVNNLESPLSALYHRKTADGVSFLTDAEFKAGEQLRRDFTCANLMPRVTANWEAGVGGRGRSYGNGVAELTDMMLAARFRVEKAMAAVGPELAGVLLDVCCFLKGLEMVERERRWPVRSAKLLLKTALSVLDRHYNPPAQDRFNRSIVHWGTQDYRPKMSG
ncbi:MAG: DUF6456 domain-containing protein [Phyllobacterium sp.]